MRTSQMKLDIWSPYAIIGHLIHGEKTDWLPRVIVILESGPDHPFESFDGDAQFRDSKGKSISSLLDEFAERRSDNLVQLRALNLQPAQLELVGIHIVGLRGCPARTPAGAYAALARHQSASRKK
ncbi:MAG: hypothetical protein JO062_23330 [Bryobacterales bacterium]|nr:hypothetical protein [Acidobacteriota bacterium]MBV9400930.1 hypothetical protein [Bryobacterales bacterium]